jgi:predicted kinase
MFAVVVTGLPGSGKTTVAVPLAAQLNLPLISKDHIKEMLADHLGLGPLASQEYGRAAVHVMLGLAARAPEVVLESFFWPGFPLSEPALIALHRPLLQVHCRCDPILARARFEARVRAGERHPVHHAMDGWERFSDRSGLLDLPAPLVTVDTSAPLDVAQVVAEVRAALAGVRA